MLLDPFSEYVNFRNKIRYLPIDESMAVIWAYCCFLQIDGFEIPKNIEASTVFLESDFPQQYISEWELEILAKEIILHGRTFGPRLKSLHSLEALAEVINLLKGLENNIYRENSFDGGILVELTRIAHRQFPWQNKPIRDRAIIRYSKILNRARINEISIERLGMSIWEIFMVGFLCVAHFLTSPSLRLPLSSEIKALPSELIDKFLCFVAKPIDELRLRLKSEQRYDADFAYAYNSLRANPLVKVTHGEIQTLYCPLLPLLFWRFTSGLYYDLIQDNRFSDELGEGFQNYVGNILAKVCLAPMQSLEEREYSVGKRSKRTSDWIIYDSSSALFIECKAKRLPWNAKASITDLAPIEANIDILANAVVQIYKTIVDYLSQSYPHFPAVEGRSCYPIVITMEDWRLFGPEMPQRLLKAVLNKFQPLKLSESLINDMPYSIWSVEEFEVGAQVMQKCGIGEFMDGKLRDDEMRQWDWRAYMRSRYSGSLPNSGLFEEEYNEMFKPLFEAQCV